MQFLRKSMQIFKKIKLKNSVVHSKNLMAMIMVENSAISQRLEFWPVLLGLGLHTGFTEQKRKPMIAD